MSENLLSEPIFHNDKIRIGGRVISEPQWFDRGVFRIAHFIDENGKFYDRNKFSEKYNVSAKILIYNGCMTSIKKRIKQSGINVIDNFAKEEPLPLQLIHSVPKGAKVYYNQLLSSESKPNCCAKWEHKFSDKINWKKIFKQIQQIKEVKLRWFQMPIVHIINRYKRRSKTNG